MNYVKSSLRLSGPASNLQLNEALKRRQAAGETLHHMAFGQSPFPVPDTLAELLGSHAPQAAYLGVSGCHQLKRQVLAANQAREGYDHFDESSVVIGPGSKQILWLTMLCFEGDIFLPSPSWTTYRPQALLAGKEALPVTSHFEGGWKLTAPSLDEAFARSANQKMLVICNPDNPTGALYTPEEMRSISEVLEKHKVVLMTDEIYSQLTYPGYQFHSFAQFYPQRTIVTSGFSKWLSIGGWRLGYGLFPAGLAPLLDAVVSACSQSHSLASVPVQLSVAEYLGSHAGDVGRYTEGCARILKCVADFVQKELTSVKGIKCHKSHSGYYLFPDFNDLKPSLPQLKTGQDLCDFLLAETRVAIMPGSEFLRSHHDWSGRLCYVNFDGGKALQALESGAELNDEFVRIYCPDVYAAMNSIKKRRNPGELGISHALVKITLIRTMNVRLE